MGHNVYSKYVALTLLCLNLLMAMSASGEVEGSASLSSGGMSFPRRELLLLQEVPVVITPAKVAQPILESPSTITVLTRDDIRRYGITSFSDILRNVPGVDVISMSPADRNLSIRGFNGLTSGKILSLVDSRPIYLDFYGETLWESLPVSISEIERIEVIRGPGSALYGANAFDGIVNIITDSASAALGTKMIANVDQFGTLSGSVIHGGGIGHLAYKASAGWDRTSGWDEKNTGENNRFNGRLQYATGDRSNLSLSGGVQDCLFDLTELSESDPIKANGTVKYMEMDHVISDFKCVIFWHGVSGDVKFGEGPKYPFESDTFDTDLQHSFQLLEHSFITCGLNYRFNRFDSEILDGLHSQNLWAAYVQNQLKLSEALTLTAGLRYDKHPLTGHNFSPRGSIVYSPAMGHAFRASAGHAFWNPPFAYSYASTNYKISTPMIPAPIDVKVIGNEELSSERITSLEFGYRGTFGDRLRGTVDTFFNRLDGLTSINTVETYAEGDLFPGSPGGVIPAVVSRFNDRDADALGAEIAAEFSITRWLSAHANYSYQHVTDSNTGETVDSAPRRKLNSGLCAELVRGFFVSLFANYVDGTVWDDVEIDHYALLNSVVSYRLGNIEIGLSASNLLNNEHMEHPQGDEVGRSAVLSLVYLLH